MPPKKSSKGSSSTDQAKAKASTSSDKPTSSPSKGTKRKQPSSSSQQPPSSPNKSARRSARGTPRAQPSPAQLLKFLLSTDGLALARPGDEAESISSSESSTDDFQTYSGGAAHFTPFQELLCAVVLSRPISHRLGARTVRTLFNAPYELNSARAIREAGGERVHKALWDARTQHKGKTAEQIDGLADVVLEKFAAGGGDKDERADSLEEVREQAGHDVQKERDLLKDSVKGLGKTGLDIFFRRIQWKWPKCYPFVDGRTKEALIEMGLPDEGQELDQLIRDEMGQLDVPEFKGRDNDEKRRSVFVIVLERAVGSHLEGNVEEVLKKAAAV